MYPNLLALFLSVIEYGSRLAWADKEIETYCGIIDSTSDLLFHVNLTFQTLVAFLTEEHKRWVEGEMQRSQTALANATNIMERKMGKGLNGRWLRSWGWVLKDREAAETYKSVVLQCHSTLLEINLELALVEGTRLEYSPPSSEVGHIENTVQQKRLWDQCEPWSKDDLCVGTPHSYRTTLGQQRHLTFPMMSPRHRVSEGILPASITGLPTYLDLGDREREVEIHSWLLKNAMQKAR
ncbi:hypothetical protein FGG08_002670 [Glutinoglossum americanum]|uniref:Uncharacterized protein n=1 Tax=Glutinoglossum americanum TaxID=1670608 RepID=A0A9P8KYY5_9PEZI|nr:hypothetical protein FGG08_002670 [Glutinoglossum americanum]